jgi:hypothetical protein
MVFGPVITGRGDGRLEAFFFKQTGTDRRFSFLKTSCLSFYLYRLRCRLRYCTCISHTAVDDVNMNATYVYSTINTNFRLLVQYHLLYHSHSVARIDRIWCEKWFYSFYIGHFKRLENWTWNINWGVRRHDGNAILSRNWTALIYPSIWSRHPILAVLYQAKSRRI